MNWLTGVKRGTTAMMPAKTINVEAAYNPPSGLRMELSRILELHTLA
jgi:hypothetical protein